MKHSVHFQNAENHWDNALPMGNGCYGGMLFYDDHQLHMPINHYEVYYTTTANVRPVDKTKPLPPWEEWGKTYKASCIMADNNRPAEGEPFCYYREHRADAFDPTEYFEENISGANPSTGELIFSFEESLQEGEQSLTLYVENAAISLDLQKDDKKLQIHTVTAREDCIINQIVQTEPLLKSICLDMTPYRDQDDVSVTYTQIAPELFAYTVTRILKNSDKPFTFAVLVRLVGATGTLCSEEKTAKITIEDAGQKWYVLTGVYTQWRYQEPLQQGIEEISKLDIEKMYADHQNYWQAFFEKSSVCLPDKFLEHSYYINQYALDSCSGKNGVMYHHACGLNGLWDVRHPCLWESVWYWDVNIQAAFAGTFSSNRLDLAKVFSDGFLSYENVIEKFTKKHHNLPGWALDYAALNYYCILPWCAHYLWFLYEYSMDEAYLRKEAYPVFLKLCAFAVEIMQYDPQTDTYFLYPDISPEQGPLAHNTVASIASIKYMLQFTLKAAEILGDTDPLLEKVRELLEKMPAYPISAEGNWGVHMRDSEEAPDNLWIRHPGMLMPVFPVGEYSVGNGDPEMLKIFSNTVDYLEERCEIGVFQGSWIAAAAARLGRGQTALRLLYERGMDHMLRSNGLCAEETERFVFFCSLNRQPLYYPCMMEYTGEMLAAVNEMLLQSHDGTIRVFPALPDGDPEWERMIRNGFSVTEYIDRCAQYPAWETVKFDKLLAKGAFAVSASLTEGKLDFIQLHSQKGGKARILSPYLKEKAPVFCNGEEVQTCWENGALCFETVPGGVYRIGQKTVDRAEEAYCLQKLMRQTYTKRRISIGEDDKTNYHKAIDGFIRDWYLGNQRIANHTLYKFDFGVDGNKRYTDTWTRQRYVFQDMALLHTPIIFLGADNGGFTVKRGYGFADCTGITAVDREVGDCFCRDFFQGEEKAEFVIDAPKGQYELLVVSGDEGEDSVTVLEAENGLSAGGELVKKGRFQCEVLPIIKKKDTPIRLTISTKPGYKWKLNCLFLNANKGY